MLAVGLSRVSRIRGRRISEMPAYHFPSPLPSTLAVRMSIHGGETQVCDFHSQNQVLKSLWLPQCPKGTKAWAQGREGIWEAELALEPLE